MINCCDSSFSHVTFLVLLVALLVFSFCKLDVFGTCSGENLALPWILVVALFSVFLHASKSFYNTQRCNVNFDLGVRGPQI